MPTRTRRNRNGNISERQARTRGMTLMRLPLSVWGIFVATILALHGEQLQQGDWIITGAAAKPAPVQVGDVITLAMGQLGTVELEII